MTQPAAHPSRALASEPPRSSAAVRAIGGLAGGVLAGVVFWLVWEVTAIPALGGFLPVRALLSDPTVEWAPAVAGFFASVGLSGAVAGWLFGPRAAWGQRWAGQAMGFVTYALAVMLAPNAYLAVAGPVGRAPSGLGGIVLVAPLMIVVGVGLLAPLLPVALVSGATWSRLVGILARGRAAERPANVRPIPGTLLVVLGILVLCGWLAFGGPAVLLLGDHVSAFPFAFGPD